MKYYARSTQPFSIHLATLVAAALTAVAACSSEDPKASSTENEATEPKMPSGEAPKSDSDAPVGSGEPTPPAAEPTEATCKKAPPSNVCGVAPQCGCPADQTCDVPDATGTAVCTWAGEVAMGKPCGTTSDCTRGLTCIFGSCHAFCDNPGSPCTSPGTGACEQIKTTEGTDVPNLAICRIACSPHDPLSCGGSTPQGIGACYADGKGGSDCQTGSAKVEGDDCSSKEPCGPGFVCTSARGAAKSTCKKWCRVGQQDCGTGKTCNGFDPSVKIGDVVYGACP